MIGAGLLAKKAVERGLTTKPWVKSSLAPGSRVVTDYLQGSGLLPYLEQLRFNVVGYGCTTCIGNSGPLPEVGRPADRRALAGRGRRPEREPELRGAGAPAGSRQLPRLAGPGRGLRARGPGGHRPRAASRSGPARTAGRSSCATSGRPRRKSSRRWPSRSSRSSSSAATRRSSRATRPGRRSRCPRGAGTPGTESSTYVQEPPFFRDLPAEPPAAPRHQRCPGARRARRLGHDRPHLARRLDPEERSGRALPEGARRRAGGLEHLRLPPRQPRGDDARDVRQRAHQQRAGARARRGTGPSISRPAR